MAWEDGELENSFGVSAFHHEDGVTISEHILALVYFFSFVKTRPVLNRQARYVVSGEMKFETTSRNIQNVLQAGRLLNLAGRILYGVPRRLGQVRDKRNELTRCLLGAARYVCTITA